MEDFVKALVVSTVVTAAYYWFTNTKRDSEEPYDYSGLVGLFIVVALVSYMLFVMMKGNQQDEMMKYIDKGDPKF